MVYQTYSAEFKINTVKEYLTYRGSIRSFCSIKNIKPYTFYPWLRKYRSFNNDNKLIDLVNPVKEATLPAVYKEQIKKTFEVKIKGASMVFDLSDLKIVLEALK